MTGTRRAWLLLVAAAVSALGVFAIGALARYPYPASSLVVDAIVGWSFLAAGLVAWDRRPENRIGPLMVLAGIAWFIGDLVRAESATVSYVAFVFRDWWDPILAVVVLAYPTGRLIGWPAKAVAAGWIVVQGGWSLAKAVYARPYVWDDCPACPDTLQAYTDAALQLSDLAPVELAMLGLLTIPTLLIVGWRWLTSRGAARRLLSPVLASGVFLILVQAFVFTSSIATDPIWLLPDGSNFLAMLQSAGRIVLAVSIVAGVLRLRSTQAALPGAVVELGALPTTTQLESVLRRRLGDPDLQVVRWSSPLGSYLDSDGRPMGEPIVGEGRRLIPLERDGRPVAGVILDAALDDPGLAATISGLVGLSVDATDVRDELRARGGDAADLPAGEVTFLFGDVEDSTALVESLGDGYAELLAELRRIVTAVAAGAGGRVVDARGDEVFLAFTRPADGVAAAVELQDRLAHADWPAGARVRVRIGLHTGHPELGRSGYVGLDVHRASRVMAAAHGGQILATDAVVAGLDASVPVTVRPLGRYALRGLSEPTPILQVEAPGSIGSFPPLRAEPAS
jgi:class 3 adenylate cyclase